MSEILSWYGELDPTFAFLAILPFIVVGIALAAEAIRRPARDTTRNRAPTLSSSNA